MIGSLIAPPPHLLYRKGKPFKELIFTFCIYIITLCSTAGWQNWKYLWLTITLVVSQWQQVQWGAFFITFPYVGQKTISIPKPVWCSFGCCRTFSQVPSDFQTQHKAIVPALLRGTQLCPLAQDVTHRYFMTPTVNSMHLKHIMFWANISTYCCSENSMGTNVILGWRASCCPPTPPPPSFSPLLDSLPGLFHLIDFYMCLVAVLLPVSREN